jgi:hypothetical protein
MSADYAENLLRYCAANLQFQSAMQAAHQMYGKSYFALGVGEKLAVDQAVQSFLASNFQGMIPEYFAGKQGPAVGFLAGVQAAAQADKQSPPAGSSDDNAGKSS